MNLQSLIELETNLDNFLNSYLNEQTALLLYILLQKKALTIQNLLLEHSYNDVLIQLSHSKDEEQDGE